MYMYVKEQLHNNLCELQAKMSCTNRSCVQLGKCTDEKRIALDVHFPLWPIIAILLYIRVDYPPFDLIKIGYVLHVIDSTG